MVHTFFQAIHLLLLVSKKRRLRLVLAVVNSMFLGASIFGISYFLGLFINDLSESLSLAKTHFSLFILSSFSYSLAKLFFRNFFERICEEIDFDILDHYFLKIYNLPYVWHVENSTGYITSVIKRIAANSNKILNDLLYKQVPYLVSIALFFAYSASLSLQLALYFCVSTALLLLIEWLSYGKRIQLASERSKTASEFDKAFVDLLFNIKTLKKLFLKKFAENKIGKGKQSAFPLVKKLLKYNAKQWAFLDIGLLVMFIIPGIYYFNQVLLTGQGIATVVIIFSSVSIFSEFSSQFMNFMLQMSRSQADFSLLQEKIIGNEEQKEGLQLRAWNTISFDQTHYKYVFNNKAYQHSIDALCIQKGEKIAIVGASGSGKTTFLNLISRNIKPISGSISLDGKNINELSEKALENLITYISQDVEIFDMTLKENILLGKHTDEKFLENVLQKVNLLELFHRLDGNWNQVIGEKGAKVSGGEKQRINLARALIFNRDILLLDEITANLDKETTKVIWKNIFEEYKDKTIIAVSHEDELLKYVDKILEFKDGKIVKVTIV